MGKHKPYSFSIPVELADQIDDHCAKTEISKSKYVVKLLQASLNGGNRS
jgi:hypothetical protein